jgi:hypothetical protein
VDLIFVLRTVDSLVYNARNTHLGVRAFSKPVFKIATLEWVCRFFTAVWSSNYVGLAHDCAGQGYVLLWVVRKTQFLIGEVLAMISTAVKLQTTNVLSLQHSILSEACNVNLYGLMQHTTCFTTWAKVIWSKADSGGTTFVQQRSTFCPTHLYFPFLYTLVTLLAVLSYIITSGSARNL